MLRGRQAGRQSGSWQERCKQTGRQTGSQEAGRRQAGRQTVKTQADIQASSGDSQVGG
jgi:hypothetical protein